MFYCGGKMDSSEVRYLLHKEDPEDQRNILGIIYHAHKNCHDMLSKVITEICLVFSFNEFMTEPEREVLAGLIELADTFDSKVRFSPFSKYDYRQGLFLLANHRATANFSELVEGLTKMGAKLGNNISKIELQAVNRNIARVAISFSGEAIPVSKQCFLEACSDLSPWDIKVLSAKTENSQRVFEIKAIPSVALVSECFTRQTAMYVDALGELGEAAVQYEGFIKAFSSSLRVGHYSIDFGQMAKFVEYVFGFRPEIVSAWHNRSGGGDTLVNLDVPNDAEIDAEQMAKWLKIYLGSFFVNRISAKEYPHKYALTKYKDDSSRNDANLGLLIDEFSVGDLLQMV